MSVDLKGRPWQGRRQRRRATHESAVERELIDTGSDKRYVRRGARGRSKVSGDVGKSLSQDRRKKATTKVKSGQGDKGDR